LIQENKDPVNSILRSKREASRFQILVEIAENQPAIRQLEIAEKLGVTPQAVSDHIRELVEEGMVSMTGRSNYAVTRTGIEWVLANAQVLESYIRHIRLDIIQHIAVWPAVAAEDLKSGEAVGLFMKDGYLYAGKKSGPATATVYEDAEKNEDVGIIDVNGIIDHHEGVIHICKIPRIQHGGSRRVDRDRLKEIVATTRMTAAAGIEASAALKSIGKKPDLFFGAFDGVIDAALHGITCSIVLADNDLTNFLRRLENTSLTYVIHDLTRQ
jgi:putative transcriptional regulator